MSRFGETLAFPSTLLTGLTNYWKLDESSGTRVNEISGAASLTAVNNPLNAVGKLGNGALFVAASSQYIKCASNASLQMGNNDRTFSMWIKLNSKSGTAQRFNIKGTGASAAATEYSLDFLTASDRFRWSCFNATGTTVSANNFGSPSTGVFYLIIAWHDSTADQIGISINNGTADTAAFVGGANALASDFQIGSDPTPTFPADAVIDACGIWSRLLTATEKASLYCGNAGTPYPFIGMQ